jgi:hypothetical protein
MVNQGPHYCRKALCFDLFQKDHIGNGLVYPYRDTIDLLLYHSTLQTHRNILKG